MNIPVALKQIIADHWRTHFITLKDLSEKYNVSIPSIVKFKDKHPLREAYIKIFGHSGDIEAINTWVTRQVELYEALKKIQS